MLRLVQWVLVLFVPTVSLCGSVSIGMEAPAFSGTAIDGNEVSLKDYRGKLVVLEWTNHRCPYVRKQYARPGQGELGNLPSLQRQSALSAVPIIWIMIDSTNADQESYLSAEGWKAQLEQWGACPTNLLIDEYGAISSLYGVQRTPEVFLIDTNGTLIYRGAIDSLRGSDAEEIQSPENIPWLKRALEQARLGREVIPSETIPYGCPIR